MSFDIDLENFKEDNTLVVSESFVSNVFAWMFAALGLTALSAYLFGTSEELLPLLYSTNPNQNSVGLTIFGWIVMFAPLVLVYLISSMRRTEKMRFGTMVVLYIIYSIVMGISLSFIFIAYTEASIAKTFLVAAAMFGLMAIFGYVTKKDLSKLGMVMMMGLIGIIIATLLNIFLHSETIDFITSIVGVLLFTVITAYDMQAIKKMAMIGFESHEKMSKISIQSALKLYLDIINLFLYLLKFYGKGRR